MCTSRVRVAEQLKQELALLVQREITGAVTISYATVSRDLGHADIYFTLLGELSQVQQNLQHASGFLRSQIARRINLRHMPSLRFHYDSSVVRGHSLSALIDKAVSRGRGGHIRRT